MNAGLFAVRNRAIFKLGSVCRALKRRRLRQYLNALIGAREISTVHLHVPFERFDDLGLNLTTLAVDGVSQMRRSFQRARRYRPQRESRRQGGNNVIG
ncbi:MAG: hypothetical protein DMF57_15435 [Acidobacteria bacterium]|nr:MAG: hypothetical protein DMF57_15435 [Acidobacteriota bacterium]